MVGVTLRQEVQPFLRKLAAVVFRDRRLERSLRAAFEADVVAGRAYIVAPHDHFSSLRAEVALEAVQMLGRLVDFYLGEPQVGQCLHEEIRIDKLCFYDGKM